MRTFRRSGQNILIVLWLILALIASPVFGGNPEGENPVGSEDVTDQDNPADSDEWDNLITPGNQNGLQMVIVPRPVRISILPDSHSENTVQPVKAIVYATSTDAKGNALRSDGWPTPEEFGNYEMTVHIPEEQCKADGTQTYKVRCVVYYAEDKSEYIAFKARNTDVPFSGETPTLRFGFKAGYITGQIAPQGCQLKGGWIKAALGNRDNDDPRYVETRIRFGGDGRFRFPVQPNENIRVWGQYTLSNDWTFDLEEQTLSVAEGADVTPMWTLHTCGPDGCSGSLSGEIRVEGLGSDYVPDRHEIYLKGATDKNEVLTDGGDYELSGLRPGEHVFYVQSYFNKYDARGYCEDIFYHPYADYHYRFHHKGRAYYDFIRTDITCGPNPKNIISKAAFVKGKLSFKKNATVVAFEADQDPASPMPGPTYALIWGHGINGAGGFQGGNRNGWSQHRVTKETGDYKLLLSEGDWNVYATRFDFCHRKKLDLCGDGNEKFVNTRMFIYDQARTSNFDQQISLKAGEVVAENDFEYETGAVTVRFIVAGEGMMENPTLEASCRIDNENREQERTTVVYAWGTVNDDGTGEATLIGTPGTYTVIAKAKVNGEVTTFGKEELTVVAGSCQTFEFGAPTLTTDEQASDLDPCGGEITLAGKATDADEVTGVTINGEPVDFISTENPDDPGEVSFSRTIFLEEGANTIKTVVTNSNGKETSETRTIQNYTAGVFNITDGIIKADYLFDGGAYEGELGIFSLEGMGSLGPGSEEFIAEAVRRVLSGSEKGHVLIKDKEEGARFDGPLGASHEGNFNKGAYIGLKKFAMTPGDRAALVLIPDGTFEEVRNNPSATDAKKQPLFSLATANPDDGLHYGQIAGIPVEGMDNSFINAVAFEDLPAEKSDQDYNDLIVQIKGAEVCSPTLDVVISENREWRTGEDNVSSHLNIPAPGENGSWLTFTLKSPADLLVYDPEGRVIGKDGGEIPGATFEWDENGHQVVTLPALEDGDYTVVLRAIGDGGLCHLEVSGYQGDEKIVSEEKPLVIEPHQVLKTVLPVSEFTENGQIVFDTPSVPTAPDGTELTFDFDGDGDIDDSDIDRISAKWGAEEGDPEYDVFFDLDNDGRIGLYDIMSVANRYLVYEE